MLGLWTDHRIGGHPRTVHCDSSKLMQLPDEVKKLVCFVHASGGGCEWVGTGFFVFEPTGVPNARGEEQSAIYIVTARHCVQQIDQTKPPFDSIEIRLNTVDGGSEKIGTDIDLWVHHETADVSVYALAPGRDRYDYLYYPIRSYAGPFYASAGDPQNPKVELPDIGPGTEVFMTGLLVYHQGGARIMPIIRVGNISAFPEERVALSTGPDHVILIESRSIGGLSGSPVFVHFPPWRYDQNWNVAHLVPPSVPGNAGPNYLLGLVHGAWETEGNDIDGIGDASREPLNVGISAVVPIQRAIDGSILKVQREALIEMLRAKTMPRPTTSNIRTS